MYFVHSYAFYPKEKCNIKSYIKLGKNNIPAIVKKNNVVGFQFHPEGTKNGSIIIKNFITKYCI